MRFWPKSLRFDRDPVAVVLPEPLATDVRGLLVRDRYVDAVRLVRQRTHLNLMPAVLAVNAVRDSAGPWFHSGTGALAGAERYRPA